MRRWPGPPLFGTGGWGVGEHLGQRAAQDFADEGQGFGADRSAPPAAPAQRTPFGQVEGDQLHGTFGFPAGRADIEDRPGTFEHQAFHEEGGATNSGSRSTFDRARSAPTSMS